MLRAVSKPYGILGKQRNRIQNGWGEIDNVENMVKPSARATALVAQRLEYQRPY